MKVRVKKARIGHYWRVELTSGLLVEEFNDKATAQDYCAAINTVIEPLTILADIAAACKKILKGRKNENS